MIKRLDSKSTILTIFIISLLFAIQFVPQYSQNINYFHNYWDSRFHYYDPLGNRSVVNWIDLNVPNDAILMARGLEWGWMTNRHLVVPLPFDLNETKLYKEILNFNVSFLIVDQEFRNSYSNLTNLFEGGYLPLTEVEYKVSEGTDSCIYIYDTRQVLAYGKTPSIIYLPDSEDTQICEWDPQENYGDWTYMHVAESDDYQLETLLKFNLSQPSPNTAIHEATLNLYIMGTTFSASLSSVEILLSIAENSDWRENNVTWNNKPNYTNYTSFQCPTNIQGWISFNITELVERFKGEVISIYIQLGFLSTQDTCYLRFASKESSTDFSPYLKIVL